MSYPELFFVEVIAIPPSVQQIPVQMVSSTEHLGGCSQQIPVESYIPSSLEEGGSTAALVWGNNTVGSLNREKEKTYRRVTLNT